MFFETAIVLALALDQLMGDPRWLPHPVKTIGNLCLFLEKKLRALVANQTMAGVCTVVFVVMATCGFTTFLVTLAFTLGSVPGYVVSTLILYTTIAAKDLRIHSEEVFHWLHTQPDLEKARSAVGMIVGRDTGGLDREGVSKACVETVAENMVDGVTAPLFYGIVCGLFALGTGAGIGAAAIGAMTYKAINTMDSMFGYKNEKYLHFGWAAAKLDDIVNFIPARLSGVILIPTAALLQLDWRGAARIYLRDRFAHSSPNAAHSEAAVAGALGVQLAGDSTYFGKIVTKPTLGDRLRQIEPHDIHRTNKMMFVGSILFVCILCLVRRMVLLF